MISMGFEIVGIVLAAVYFGNWLDEKMGWVGFGLIGMMAAGFGGWLLHVILVVRIMERREESEKPKVE